MTQTDEPVQAVSAAMDQMAVILAGVRDDQLAEPTPCRDWDVRTLMGHVVAGPRNFLLRVGGGDPAWKGAPVGGVDEALDVFRDGADALRESWRRDDADTGLAGFAAAEFAVHAWDLARATGQSIQLDSGVAERALSVMGSSLTEENRGEAFGPAVAISDREPAYARLAALAGRNPHRYHPDDTDPTGRPESSGPTV